MQSDLSTLGSRSFQGRGLKRTAIYVQNKRKKRRKTLEKRREKEKKPKSILIFQVDFEDLKNF